MEIVLHKILFIYNKFIKRIKYKYFYKYHYISIKLRLEENRYFNFNKRHNKLFNDYKAKQIMINELQQRYLFKEGEKYTFYPIINNYIIKYNKPYFPTLPNTEIYPQEIPLRSKYSNNFDSSENFKKINYFESISNDDNVFNYNKTETNNSLKKSFHNKNSCLISIRNNLNNNKKYRKINISNFKNKHNLYENKTNIYKRKNINLGRNTNILNDEKEEYINNSNQNEMIQKANSIKTILSNDSCNRKKINQNKNLKRKKDFNKKIKILSPLGEVNYFNYNKDLRMKRNNITSGYLRNNYLNQVKDRKNNYIQNNKIEGLSLKNIIKDEKLKNSLKQRKSKDISKEKLNKVIDNIINKRKKGKNHPMIDTNYCTIDLNENPNNIRLKTENYCLLNNNELPLNKNLKTEIHGLNINNKFNRINIPKYDYGNIDSISKSITLTDNQRRQIKRYYNNNTYKNNYNTSLELKDNLINDEKHLYCQSGLKSKKINNKETSLKINLIKKIKKNKTLKEKTSSIPISSNNKIYILNKISESKRRMKNKLLEEKNYQTVLNSNIHKYKGDFNKTKNHEIKQNINKTELLFKGKEFYLIDKNIAQKENNSNFSLKGRNSYITKNKRKINNEKILNNRNKKIKSQQIAEIEAFGFQGYKKNNHPNIIDEKDDLSIQSLSDSKVFEIANTYIDDQVDKTKVSDILVYKKKQNQYS